MHYQNERVAKVNDLVRGKYDGIKHDVIGILTHASPTMGDTCNGKVVTVARSADGWGSTIFAPILCEGDGESSGGWRIAGENFMALSMQLTVNLRDFVALDPKTGEVLPAES